MSQKEIDLSIQIKRFPETQTYQANFLIIRNGKPAQFETNTCLSLVEVFEKAQAFEQKYLSQFENMIEYEKVSFRELAAQNLAAQKAKNGVKK